jgi:DNA-binding NarL/FixJ family response regulator
MPRLNGIETARLIKEAVPDTQIVILSMYDKETFVREAFSLGALGCVLKAAPGSEVIEAVRAAHRGEYFLSPQIRAGVIHTHMESSKEIPSPIGYDLLTNREQQILRLVVEGNSTACVADILHLSPKTVEKHRTNVGKNWESMI